MPKKIDREKIAAEVLAEKQREISVSEFFLKNRQLLGFDNPKKALLTAVKEAVDNSLDACEDMRVLPEISVSIKQIEGSENRFKIVVEDNGPGIVDAHIPRVFGKLLYGSKFHSLKCSRGQQGIGISAVTLYGQLTTGKGIRVFSKISPKKPASFFEIHIDTKHNEPMVVKHEKIEWENKDHGLKLEVELEGRFTKGRQSVEDYLKQVAMVNPHAHIIYVSPENETFEFVRAINNLPVEPKEIKPHPYGIELGMLIKMLKETKARTLQAFLQTEFCRVSSRIAKEICKKAGLYEKARPSRIAVQEAETLYKAIQKTKIMSPPTNCLVPIGEEEIVEGLKKEVHAEFFAAVTRPPAVYRGRPFLIEVGIAYGGNLPTDDLVKVYRFANRVPLMYQQSACASTQAIINTTWRNYGLSQSKGALPVGPAVILVHMSSVWVPFTSEAKEAIAPYPEIIKEMKLALQECGRKLGSYIRKTIKARQQRERASLFEKYIPEVASAISKLSGEKREKLILCLNKILRKEYKIVKNAEEKEEKHSKG